MTTEEFTEKERWLIWRAVSSHRGLISHARGIPRTDDEGLVAEDHLAIQVLVKLQKASGENERGG